MWNSAYGNDDADRDVMSANLSVSYDSGETWEHCSLTEIVKPENCPGDVRLLRRRHPIALREAQGVA